MSTGGSYRIDEKGKKTLVDRPTQDNPKGNGPIDADAPRAPAADTASAPAAKTKG